MYLMDLKFGQKVLGLDSIEVESISVGVVAPALLAGNGFITFGPVSSLVVLNYPLGCNASMGRRVGYLRRNGHGLEFPETRQPDPSGNPLDLI